MFMCTALKLTGNIAELISSSNYHISALSKSKEVNMY